MTSKFEVTKWFPEEVYRAICAVRASGQVHSIVRKQARKRKKRTELIQNDSENVALLACDHPARMVIDPAPGSNSGIMGDRYELLGRILRVLVVKEWDGVMVTPDLFEDLMILRHILIERGQEDFAEALFDNRVFIGSMNRGGLAGSVFELDDRFTAFTHAGITKNYLDGAKMMFRLDLTNRDSLETIEACARAITQMAGVPVFLECFEVEWDDEKGKLQSVEGADSLVRVVSVAQALGNAPRNLWLKLPYGEGFERVARATTCPIVLLGGSTRNEEGLQSFFEDIHKGLASGSNVRGVMVGRNVLFPPDGGDPYVFARAVSTLVHHEDDFSADKILDMLERFSKEEVREDFSKIT